MADQPVRKNGGVLVDCVMLLAEIQGPTLIGEEEESCLFLSIWRLLTWLQFNNLGFGRRKL